MFAKRRANRKRNKRKRIAKNRVKYLPKDGHGSIHARIREMEASNVVQA